MTNNDKVDQILDDALAEYREAEPLAGLEDRVLQRLRLQTERRRKAWWRWSAITAVAAALSVVVWVGLSNRAGQETVASSVVQKQPTLPKEPMRASDARAASKQSTSKRSPEVKTVSRGDRIPVVPQLASTGHAPMRQQFPSPAPLKPEERMLLALATTHPEVLTNSPDGDKEIVIVPITIQPLVNETGDYQGEN